MDYVRLQFHKTDSLKNVLHYVVGKIMNDHRSNFKSYVTPRTADKYLFGQETPLHCAAKFENAPLYEIFREIDSIILN